MIQLSIIERIPLGLFYALSVLIVFVAIEGGFRLGRLSRRHLEDAEQAPIGSMVGATLGLLAFMLAFAFSIAAGRFDLRKTLVLQEANAIGTTYLRAAFFPEPRQTTLQQLLAEYVDLRIVTDTTPQGIEKQIAAAERLQETIWSEAAALGRENPRSVPVGLFVQSLNEMIDLHTERVTAGIWYRFPPNLWWMLFGVTLLSMAALGYQIGLTGRRNLYALFLLALTFSMVIVLIEDYNRPQKGLIRINQHVLIDLRDQLAAGQDRR